MEHLSSITSNWRDFKAKSVSDLLLIRQLRVTQNLGNDQLILEVVWLPLVSECVKLNIDGCSKRDPGRSGFGGILRDSSGVVLGSFSRSIHMGTNYLAEHLAFIYGAKYVIRKGFTNVWIECDSFGIIWP
ncbi:hypothetical protein AMTRI_Chr06g172580 [Amborella trichopoda]